MIDPRHSTLEQWTDSVNLTLATAGPLARLHDGDWKRWAYTLLAIPSIAAFSPPDPRGFATWQDWAERFVEAVPT